MSLRRYFPVIAVLWLILSSVPAHAQLGVGMLQIGPEDAVSGFPATVSDSVGTTLGLCLDPVYCLPDPPVAGNAFSEEIGFGASAVYWSAEASITLPAGRASFTAAVVAGFANGNPVDGEQEPKTIIRIRMDVAPGEEGIYRFGHPFGEIDINAATSGPDAIDYTREIPFTGIFDAPFTGNVAPLLTAVSPAPPAGFIGDPYVLQTITRGPSGNNLFRVRAEVPANLDGQGGDRVETTLFRVQGQILSSAPVMTATPAALSLATGQHADVTIVGALGGIAVSSSNLTIASAFVSGSKVRVTGGTTSGTATIMVTDSMVPPNTVSVQVNVSATTLCGDRPGLYTQNVLPDQPLSLKINISNSSGTPSAQIVQEWFIFGIGSTATGLLNQIYFLTSAGTVIPLEASTNPAAVTFSFDHTEGTFFIGATALGGGGLGAGQFLVYAYAFATNPMTSFADVSNLVIENVVLLNVQ